MGSGCLVPEMRKSGSGCYDDISAYRWRIGLHSIEKPSARLKLNISFQTQYLVAATRQDSYLPTNYDWKTHKRNNRKPANVSIGHSATSLGIEPEVQFELPFV